MWWRRLILEITIICKYTISICFRKSSEWRSCGRIPSHVSSQGPPNRVKQSLRNDSSNMWKIWSPPYLLNHLELWWMTTRFSIIVIQSQLCARVVWSSSVKPHGYMLIDLKQVMPEGMRLRSHISLKRIKKSMWKIYKACQRNRISLGIQVSKSLHRNEVPCEAPDNTSSHLSESSSLCLLGVLLTRTSLSAWLSVHLTF